MRKQWMVVGVVVLAFGAAAPLAVGYVTEQQWQSVAQDLNDSQDVFRLETQSYDRGYMNSSIIGSVTVLNPDTGGNHAFDYQAQVTHGVTGSLMDFSTAETASAEVKKFFPDEKPRLTLETRLWGTATVEVTVPAIDVTDEGSDETLQASEGYGRIDIGSAWSEADIRISWPGLTLTGPDADISISEFKVDQTMELLAGDVWLSNGDMTLDGMQVMAPGQPAFELSDLSVTSESSASNDNQQLSGNTALRLQSVSVDGTEFGPHEIQFRFDGLDVAGLNELSGALRDIQDTSGGAAGSNDPQAAMQLQMDAMDRISSAMLDLATEGFTAGFSNIELTTPQGSVTGEMMVSHPTLPDDQRSEAMMVMQGLTGSLNLSMPLALADQYPVLGMQLRPLIKQGMVVQDGDRLRLDGSLADMALTINGNVMPLPPLF